jgi:hypothetical protein
MSIKSQILKLNNGHEPQTFNEVAEAVLKVMQHNTSNTVVGFAWDVRYQSSRAHNSHEVKDKYKPYDACMVGRVWIRLAKRNTGWAPDVLKNTLTYHGTGGYGSYNGPWEHLYKPYHTAKEPLHYYSYDYSFVVKDWPALFYEIEKRRTLSLLTNDPLKISHAFKWIDPAVTVYDNKLLAQYHELELV